MECGSGVWWWSVVVKVECGVVKGAVVKSSGVHWWRPVVVMVQAFRVQLVHGRYAPSGLERI